MLRRVVHLNTARRIYNRRKERNAQHQRGEFLNARQTRVAESQISCGVDSEPSTPRQFNVLSVLVMLAVITGISVETCPPIRVCLFIALFSFIGFSTTVHFIGRSGATTLCIITGVTSVLILFTGALSLFLAKNPQFLIPCHVLALSITVSYLAVVMWRSEGIHILITWTVVIPASLLSIVHSNLRIEYRCALLVPALTLLGYKAAAMFCCTCDDMMSIRPLLKKLIRIPLAVMLLGGLISASSVAFSLSPALCALGFVVTVTGSIGFNALQMVKRWEEPDLPDHKVSVKWMAFVGSVLTIFLMFIFLMGVYFFLDYDRVVVFLPIFLLIVLYWMFYFQHNTIWKETPNGAYFLMILVFIAVSVYCTLYSTTTNTALFESCNQQTMGPSLNVTSSKLQDSSNKKVDKILIKTLPFAALQCILMIIYFMMTVLVKTDDLVAESTEAVEEELPSQEEGPSGTTTGEPSVHYGTSPNTAAISIHPDHSDGYGYPNPMVNISDSFG